MSWLATKRNENSPEFKGPQKLEGKVKLVSAFGDDVTVWVVLKNGKTSVFETNTIIINPEPELFNSVPFDAGDIYEFTFLR